MRALILQTDSDAAVASSRALIDKGFEILCVKNRDVAETLIRMDTIDLLVMDEQIDGCLTHAIALSGERKNPYISSIIVTDRTKAETDDLYDLIPSLYALVGGETEPNLVGQLALSSVANVDDMRARVRKHLDADVADAVAADDLVLEDMAEVATAPERPAAVDVMTPPTIAEAPIRVVLPATANPVSATDDDIDIPSYADLIFATPALAELAHADYFDVADNEIEDATDDPIGPKLPDMAGVFIKPPLMLTDSVSA